MCTGIELLNHAFLFHLPYCFEAAFLVRKEDICTLPLGFHFVIHKYVILINFQIRVETDPADRTQLRITIASGDPTLTFEYVSLEFPTLAPFNNLICVFFSTG